MKSDQQEDHPGHSRGARAGRSLQDLLRRVPIPEGDGTLLIKAGALDSLEPGMSRSQIMWIFLAHVRSHSTVVQQTGSTGHLFAFHGTDYPVPPLKDYDVKTQLRHETETLGFLLSTHPLTLYEPRLKGLQYILQAKDMKKNIGKDVTMVGWCITSRTVISHPTQQSRTTICCDPFPLTHKAILPYSQPITKRVLIISYSA